MNVVYYSNEGSWSFLHTAVDSREGRTGLTFGELDTYCFSDSSFFLRLSCCLHNFWVQDP